MKSVSTNYIYSISQISNHSPFALRQYTRQLSDRGDIENALFSAILKYSYTHNTHACTLNNKILTIHSSTWGKRLNAFLCLLVWEIWLHVHCRSADYLIFGRFSLLSICYLIAQCYLLPILSAKQSICKVGCRQDWLLGWWSKNDTEMCRHWKPRKKFRPFKGKIYSKVQSMYIFEEDFSGSFFHLFALCIDR